MMTMVMMVFGGNDNGVGNSNGYDDEIVAQG